MRQTPQGYLPQTEWWAGFAAGPYNTNQILRTREALVRNSLDALLTRADSDVRKNPSSRRRLFCSA